MLFFCSRGLTSPAPVFVMNNDRETILKLSENILTYWLDRIPDELPLPHLDIEETPSYANAMKDFIPVLTKWKAKNYGLSISDIKLFREVFAEVDLRNLLALLGMRLTPGSIITPDLHLPIESILLEAATQPYNRNLTVASRELSKHILRSEKRFWGEIEGSGDEKNAYSKNKLQSIFEDKTWSNIFGHFKHKSVYEIRVESGHGARWTLKDGIKFIGFVEPFESVKHMKKSPKQ